MLQWLLNALLCLCWQRLSPPALLSPMSQLPWDTCPALGWGTHPPRAAQCSPVPAQELQHPHPRAAPSLLKGRGLERDKQG